MTQVRYSNHSPITSREKDAANQFVQSILDALPDGVVGQTIYGWDVGLKPYGSFVVFEANIAGIHLEFEPGFHFSGFFLNSSRGPLFAARLLLFLESAYGTTITIADPALSKMTASEYIGGPTNGENC